MVDVETLEERFENLKRVEDDKDSLIRVSR
jgi:hypothetical protein